MTRNSTTAGVSTLDARLDLYTEVTQTIVAQMESGTLPWTRPWKTTASAGLPTNALTTNRYSGINVVLLWLSGAMKGYSDRRWMTYRQAVQAGGHVRRGERGTMIVKASTYVPQGERERAQETAEDPRVVPYLKRYTVFNLDQIEGVALPEQAPAAPVVANAALDAFVAATGVDIRYGGNEAYYVPSRDYIQCPEPQAFENAFDLFRVQSHEMAHWSGAAHRLDRTFGQRFGDAAYQMEELVALS
jgi:antirestriction protein ArdC